MHESQGILRYEKTDTWYRLTVEVDRGLSDYYRNLIPKWHYVQPQKWPAHITVVRPIKETPVTLEYWDRYEGEEINFFYEPYVYSGRVYYWLNIWCARLEDIRRELGMPVTSPYTLPPEGFAKCFHCTIGNKKERPQ